MFTTMQTMQIAQEIQADHRRRAARWRSARRVRRTDAGPSSGPETIRGLAPVVALPRLQMVGATRDVA